MVRLPRFRLALAVLCCLKGRALNDQVTEDSATPDWHRDRMLEIDGAANSIVVPSNSDRSDRSGAAEAIVVSIASEGLTSATVSILVSTDVSKDGVMAVAAATAGKPVTFN